MTEKILTLRHLWERGSYNAIPSAEQQAHRDSLITSSWRHRQCTYFVPGPWSNDQLCVHRCIWLVAHQISFVFLPLFSERQTKRTMNKLRFAVDVKKEYIGSSPRIFNYAKHVVFFFSLGVALGGKCSQVVKLIKACNYPALFWKFLTDGCRTSKRLLIHLFNKNLLNTYYVLVLFQKLG